jgi:excisionase family DNA binding protein
MVGSEYGSENRDGPWRRPWNTSGATSLSQGHTRPAPEFPGRKSVCVMAKRKHDLSEMTDGVSLPALAQEPSRPVLISVTAVAQMLGISKRSVWRKLSSGELPEPVLRIGHIVRWSLKEVEAWIEQGCPPQDPRTK